MKLQAPVAESSLPYFKNNRFIVYFQLGVVQMELGNKPKALLCFDNAIHHDPDHWVSEDL